MVGNRVLLSVIVTRGVPRDAPPLAIGRRRWCAPGAARAASLPAAHGQQRGPDAHPASARPSSWPLWRGFGILGSLANPVPGIQPPAGVA
jgi:hypothetical protein